MNICIITDNSSKVKTPFMKDVIKGLSATHTVRILMVEKLAQVGRLVQEEQASLADLYLLKSHAPHGLEVARRLEALGARIINNPAAVRACQDRLLMSEQLCAAGIPWPKTWGLNNFEGDLNDELLADLSFPLMMKARYSYEGENVDKIDGIDDLKALASYWSYEPVILQACVPVTDTWDTKVWVINGQLFAAKRRSPFAQGAADQFQISLEELGDEVTRITLEVGRVFGLQVYDVDFLFTEQGPVVIDVNSFPTFRGIFGPDKALIDLVESYGTTPQLALS